MNLSTDTEHDEFIIDDLVALENFQLLLDLPKHTKLVCEKDSHKLSLDERWVSNLRRMYNGDSRNDILNPVSATFNTLIQNNLVSYHNIDECIKTLLNKFGLIYPDFSKLFDILKVYQDTCAQKVVNSKKINIENNESNNDQNESAADSVSPYSTDCDDSGVITGWDGTLWDCTEIALDGL